MSNARIIWRKTVNYVMLTLTGVAAFGVVSVLFLILGYLIWNGGTSLNLNFFTQLPKPVGETGDQLLLHQTVAPQSGDGALSVVGSGQRPGHGGHHVRVAAEVGGRQHRIAKAVGACERLEGRGEGLGRGGAGGLSGRGGGDRPARTARGEDG